MSFTDPNSVAELLPPPTLDQVRQFLLAYLTTPQDPVTNWVSGAVLRTMLEVESLLIADLSGNFLALLVANGYADSASGSSLARVAHGWYEVDGSTPTQAVQTVVVVCDSSNGPYTSGQVANLLGLAADGSTYYVSASGALSSGGSVTLTFTAAAPGLASAAIGALGNNLPGVSIQSVAISNVGSGGSNDATIQAACAARWPDLLEVPTQDRLVIWALAVAAGAVTRFRLDADPAWPGGVLLTLGASGSLPGGTVATVQAALDDLSPIGDINTAQAATNRPITASGTVTIRADLLAGAQAAADAAWVAYLAGAQIGGKVYLQKLRQVVGDAIAADPFSNFTGAALAGAGGDGNVQLASTEQPVAAGSLVGEITWIAT